jgi:periplasmic copper chaperone A
MLLGIAGLSVAIMGGLAAISCGGDDDATPGSPASQTTAQTTPAATTAPTRSAPKLGEAQIGSISITGASVRETANDVTAMYMTIKTTGTGDRLVSASTPISTMVQLHEAVMVNGAMQMQEIAGGIAVPPAGEVVLKPGGFHVMIMNLKAPLKTEQTVTFELTFEKAGKVSLTAPVKPIADTT